VTQTRPPDGAQPSGATPDGARPDGLQPIGARLDSAHRGWSPARLGWLGAGCLALCAATGAVVHAGVPSMDTALHDFAVQHRGPVLSLARTITQSGSTAVIWPVIAGAALAFPRSGSPRRWLVTAAVAAGGGAAIGVRLLLSDVVRRARPPEQDWGTVAGGFAYPSGHTNAATIGAGLLAWALTRHLRTRRARVVVWTLAVLWAGSVGLTRVLLGVHWPLDVVGGWLLGTGWLALMAALAIRFEPSPAPSPTPTSPPASQATSSQPSATPAPASPSTSAAPGSAAPSIPLPAAQREPATREAGKPA